MTTLTNAIKYSNEGVGRKVDEEKGKIKSESEISEGAAYIL